jgi:hypothetical protein
LPDGFLLMAESKILCESWQQPWGLRLRRHKHTMHTTSDVWRASNSRIHSPLAPGMESMRKDTDRCHEYVLCCGVGPKHPRSMTVRMCSFATLLGSFKPSACLWWSGVGNIDARFHTRPSSISIADPKC